MEARNESGHQEGNAQLPKTPSGNTAYYRVVN